MTAADPPDGSSTPGGRGSSLVAAGILASRVAGLVRQRAIGHFLGAGATVDAFTAALRIPNLLQNLLGEGVLSAAFIPTYSRLVDEGREEDAGRLAGAVAGFLTVVAGALVLLGVVFAEPLTAVLAWGFPAEKRDLTVTLVRILTPGLGFLVLSAWCLGVLNSHRRFFLSYVAPVLWNAAMVAALVTGALVGLAEEPLVLALAWGTFAGGVAQFAVQLPTVLRLSRGLRVSLRTDLPGARRVLRSFGPVVAGRGVVQVSAYVDLLLATFLATGGAAVLGFSQVLYLLPISLFGMSVAAAELPELSRVRVTGDEPRSVAATRLAVGMGRIAYFVVPTALVYVVLGDVVVGALYQGGEFTADVTRQVWFVLAVYSIGLPATTSSRLLQSALYALDEPRIPAVVSAMRVAVSTLVGVAAMLQLDRLALVAGGAELVEVLPAITPVAADLRAVTENQLRLGAAGLALGAAAGAWLEYLVLRRAVRARLGPGPTALGHRARIVVAAVGAVAAGALVRALVTGWHPLAAAPAVLGAAGALYLAVAAALGLGVELPIRPGRLRGRRR